MGMVLSGWNEGRFDAQADGYFVTKNTVTTACFLRVAPSQTTLDLSGAYASYMLGGIIVGARSCRIQLIAVTTDTLGLDANIVIYRLAHKTGCSPNAVALSEKS
jgi:hypothetical protein